MTRHIRKEYESRYMHKQHEDTAFIGPPPEKHILITVFYRNQ